MNIKNNNIEHLNYTNLKKYVTIMNSKMNNIKKNYIYLAENDKNSNKKNKQTYSSCDSSSSYDTNNNKQFKNIKSNNNVKHSIDENNHDHHYIDYNNEINNKSLINEDNINNNNVSIININNHKINNDTKELHSRITTVNRDLSDKIDETEKKNLHELQSLREEIKNEKTSFGSRLNQIEAWKYTIVGALMIVTWLLAKADTGAVFKLLFH
jgi:hypothetical protein